MIDLKKAEILNPVAWILNNRLVNENNSPIEFKDHSFLVDPYLDNSPQQVIMKCLSPETKILTADLQWISIDKIEIGQRILSVNEKSTIHLPRRFQFGNIIGKKVSYDKAAKLTLEDNRTIIATSDHRFLIKNGAKTDTIWKFVKDIKVGDRVRSIVFPWDKPNYEAGWMAGFIDGEGSIRRRKSGGIEAQLCQSKGNVLERAKAFLEKNDFTFKDYKKNKTRTSKKEVHFLRLSSSSSILRLLGMTQPSRFVTDESLWQGFGLTTGVGNNLIWPRVIKIQPLTKQRMIDIETTTKTFIANGLVSHNCAQIGWSTLAILRSFHLAKFAKANIIHTFPSRSISKDFVTPKVNPLISNNPIIAEMIGVDSVNLKQVGERYIYYRGSFEQTEAISISAHILINDEYDRSDQKVLKTYSSRLDDVKRERPELGWEWQFSNPYIPGAGVDVWWQKSDQKHWFVKCSHCGYDWYLNFPDNIDFDKKLRVCAKCRKPLSDDDLRNGRWVKKYKNRDISGYWVSQMMVRWISAEKIIEKSEGDPEVFHNFTLGLPYISKDTSVSRQTIVNCLSPGYNPRTNVAIGVDNGIKKHYVIGNKYGIFDVGVTDDWKMIEDLRNRYNAIMVIDALPYPFHPRKLADKYPGKVFIHYYKPDSKRMGVIRWDEDGTVKSDRTKIIDSVVGDFNARDITINMTERQLEDYINHWEKLYRRIRLTPQGIKMPDWATIEGKDDHFAHATIYWRVALEQTLSLGRIVSPEGMGTKGGYFAVNPDQTVPALDLKEVAKRIGKKKSSWKTI